MKVKVEKAVVEMWVVSVNGVPLVRCANQEEADYWVKVLEANQ